MKAPFYSTGSLTLHGGIGRAIGRRDDHFYQMKTTPISQIEIFTWMTPLSLPYRDITQRCNDQVQGVCSLRLKKHNCSGCLLAMPWKRKWCEMQGIRRVFDTPWKMTKKARKCGCLVIWLFWRQTIDTPKKWPNFASIIVSNSRNPSNHELGMKGVPYPHPEKSPWSREGKNWFFFFWIWHESSKVWEMTKDCGKMRVSSLRRRKASTSWRMTRDSGDGRQEAMQLWMCHERLWSIRRYQDKNRAAQGLALFYCEKTTHLNTTSAAPDKNQSSCFAVCRLLPLLCLKPEGYILKTAPTVTGIWTQILWASAFASQAKKIYRKINPALSSPQNLSPLTLPPQHQIWPVFLGFCVLLPLLHYVCCEKKKNMSWAAMTFSKATNPLHLNTKSTSSDIFPRKR